MSGGTLLVATPGGHVDELIELADDLCLEGAPRTWVTARTSQTASLLGDQEVKWIRPVGSRQLGAAVRMLWPAWRELRELRPLRVVSTGAAMAVPYLLMARLLRIECIYVESATRLHSPSITGRICEFLPGAVLKRQSTSGSRRRWTTVGSVFDGYSPESRQGHGYERLLITVGTERFPFPRALDRVLEAVQEQGQTIWQTGTTPAPRPLPGTCRAWWPVHELEEEVAQADVVVTHAGVGSVLTALRAGKCPVVFPRIGNLGEHVDDHQVELAHELEKRGLAVVAKEGDPLKPLLQKAARTTIRRGISMPSA